MTFAAHLPGYKLYDALKDSAFRMGVYVGLCLFAVFAAWVVAANRLIAPHADRLRAELWAAMSAAFTADQLASHAA